MKIRKMVVDGVEKDCKIPKRYMEKRKAEKEFSDLFRNREYEEPSKKSPIKNKRKSELLIPIDIDGKTVIFVRESKIYTSKKWLEYFDNDLERIKNYVESYKDSDYYKQRNEFKDTI